MKQTTLSQVKERMENLKARKAADLDVIQNKQNENKIQIEGARRAMRDASEKMDPEAYMDAKALLAKYETSSEMYAARHEQILKQEYISEADSDKVIDSLLEYEDTLASEFEASIAKPLDDLKRLLTKYQQDVAAVEEAIVDWTQNVHRNYRSQVSTYRNGSKRSETPVPVRNIPFQGSMASRTINDFLLGPAKKYIVE